MKRIILSVLCVGLLNAATQYGYDALGRLTKVVYSDGTSITYTYDSAGNRLSQVITNPAIPLPSIGVDKQNLSFSVAAGQTSQSQIVVVTNTGGGSLQWNAVPTANWLTVTPVTGTNNGALSITASAASLAAGTYNTNIQILASASNTPVTVPVSLTVTTNNGPITTITTNPPGLSLVIDGNTLTAPQNFQWSSGTQHSIGVTSPLINGGTRYVYLNWSDGSNQTHTILAPAAATTYTANFTTQYLLTTQVSPSGAGSITASPSSVDGFYLSGTNVQLTASPSATFTGWSGDLGGMTSPQSISMNGPHSVTGNFSTSTGLYFYAVTPCRVADTRGNGKTGAFGPPSISSGSTRDFPVPSGGCGIPTTAAVYSLNVTVVPPGQLTYLTMWPTGQTRPTVSTLNDFSTQIATPGNVVANAAIVPAGTNGSVSVYASDTSDVIIDINGYFASPGQAFGGLTFYPATPCRVADTRLFGGKTGALGPPSMGAGTNRSFPIPSSTCGIPATAQAYSLNMTVVPPGQLTYLTTWPSGQSMPVVSTLNDFSIGIPSQAVGKVVANAAIVPAGTSGAVSVYVSDATDVIIDINGYFAPPGGSGALSFYTATPCRVADTRGNGMSGAFGAPSMSANGTRTFPVPSSACGIPSSAQAYSLNMTVVPPGQLTYLTTWPYGQSMPVVSTLNDFSAGTVVPGRVVANAAIVPAGTNGSVCVFTSDPSDVIIDINGYFAP